MDCHNCKNNLSAYLEGDLEGMLFAEVEQHLGRCPDCQAELGRLVKMRDLLRDLRDVEVPSSEKETFIKALRSRLEAEGLRKPVRKGYRRSILVASIALVALLIVVLIIPVSNRPAVIAPARGLNAIENLGIDALLTTGLGNHFFASQGDLLADPDLTGRQILSGWLVLRETHQSLLVPEK